MRPFRQRSLLAALAMPFAATLVPIGSAMPVVPIVAPPAVAFDPARPARVTATSGASPLLVEGGAVVFC